MTRLERLRVAGYKSIRDQDVELRALNVLIGANGAGKSNFISIFRFLRQMVDEELQLAVAKAGGAERLLHFGRKRTEHIGLQLDVGSFRYLGDLVPTAEDSLIFRHEEIQVSIDGPTDWYQQQLGSGHKESRLIEESRSFQNFPQFSGRTLADEWIAAIRGWKIYHFQDTSESARVKAKGDLADNQFLRSDASNLAAFLYRLRESEPDSYRNIVDAVRMVAPFFDDFDLHPDRLNTEKIRLEWRERGSDAYFNAAALSDGTLRFMSLATLLLQPDLPATILLDEPELGLHPYAIAILTDLLRSAAERTQVVVSTQSVTLVNQLTPEEILVVERQDGESIFRRPDAAEIESWLDDYALGDLLTHDTLFLDRASTHRFTHSTSSSRPP